MASSTEQKRSGSSLLPRSDQCCHVSIINTTCDIVSASETLLEPEIPGHHWLNLPTHAFHIQHKASGDEVLFDMGCRTDWKNLPPHVAEAIEAKVSGMRVEKEVIDILKVGGVDPGKLKALILSHWHFDHSGRLSSLDPKTDLIVGPGFKDAFLPGYPAKQTSIFWEEDFKDRNVIELPADDRQRIGNFAAHDYFGDGSLHILDVPGHTVGHIAALVRTTPGTAILLGGDSCHFSGVIRPTRLVPMPEQIPPETPLDTNLPSPCPCSIFTACHPDQANGRTTPFYRCASGPTSWYEDPKAAMKSIHSLFELDADPNILTIIAHDPAAKDILPFFPRGTLDDWHAKGYKQAMHWYFVNELPVDGKTRRATLTDGLYHEGSMVKELDPKS